MSKDIRSYFSVQSAKSSTHVADKKKGKDSNASTSKKKRNVIESDSDEEEIFEKKRSIKASPDKKKVKVEKKSVNVEDVFGASSVKRTARRSTNNASEFHNDPDFDKVLQELDESQWTDGDTKKEVRTTSPSKFPVKMEPKSPSPSQEEDFSSSDKPSKHKRMTDGDTKKEVRTTSPSKYPVKREPKSPSPSEEEDFSPSDKPTKHKRMKLDSTHYEQINQSKCASGTNLVANIKKEVATSSETYVKKEVDIKRETSQDTDNIAIKKEVRNVVKTEKKVDLQTDSKRKMDPVKVPAPPSYMWVDKYKPTSIKQIIGQQGESSNVKKLMRWLSSWYANHGPGVNKKLVRPSPWAKDDSGSYFKAALLSGPPGVGKTTTAHLVCKELSLDMVEFNASDTRSKKSMNNEVSELLSSKSLLPFFQSGGHTKTSAKHVLVMDEVDGMAGNEDRGGVGELINLIKNSKCPVICMCNDRNHPKIRSLANHCFDLRFHKPRIEQIRGAMMSVCFKEKVQISPQALDEVIAGTNNDIRQILNNLSMWSSTEKKLNIDQVKTDANAAKKIIKLGPWDAVKKVFSAEDHKTMTLMDKSDVFFHDYNIMPLFVQENYLIASPHGAKKKTEILHHIARAATSISYGDLIEKTIRSSNAWSLLPVQSIFSNVVPGNWMEGHLSGQIQFPSWLGKNSRGSKMNRLLQELQLHMRLSISGGKQAVNLDYLEPVLNAVVHPLDMEGAQGVSKTLQVMQDYYLTRDDLESLVELYQWPGRPDPMSKLESKVKAALTRTYNKSGGVMTPYALDAPVKKKKGSSTGIDDAEFEADGDGDVHDKDSETDDDDDDADAMIKAKKTEKKESRGNAASSSQSSSSSRGAKGSSRGSNATRGTRGRGRGKK